MNNKPENDFVQGELLGMFLVLDYDIDNMEKGEFVFNRGSGTNFSLNAKMPIQTLHYKYPKDMYIISLDEIVKVIEVEDGVIVNLGMENLLEGQINKPVYDTFGHKLKISSSLDFKKMMFYYKKYLIGDITEEQFTSNFFVRDKNEEKMIRLGRIVSVFYKIFYNKKLLNIFSEKIKKFFEDKNIDETLDEYYNWVGNEDILPKSELDSLKKEFEALK